MSVHDGRTAFVGRRTELELLRSALDEVRAAEPRVVLVAGRPGIGKTALVRQFLAEAGDDLCVLRASGEETERLLTFGVAEQLVRSAGLPVLPNLSALGTAEAARTEPISVGAGLLGLLGTLQDQGPVAVVVDDAQWADDPSLLALLFALRRLYADRVLALVVTRDDGVLRLPEGLQKLADSDHGRRLSLAGLGVAEVEDLGAAVVGHALPKDLAERLHHHTRGNPLHTRALLAEVSVQTLMTDDNPLPAPQAFSVLVLTRLAACPPDARRLIVAAAVLGMQCRLSLAARLGEVDDPLVALEQAIEAQMLETATAAGASRIAFPHALVRSAVYHDLGPVQRAALHARAATLVEDLATSLRHRVAAAPEEDPVLAADLAGFARDEVARGAWASAASALRDASAHSTDAGLRQQLLLEAVECMLTSGDPTAAGESERIAGFAHGAYRDYLLGRIAYTRGRVTEGEALLAGAWDACDTEVDRRLASKIAMELSVMQLHRLRGPEAMAWARRALAIAEGTELAAVPLAHLVDGACHSGRVEEGFAALEHLPEHPCITSAPEAFPVIGRGLLRLTTDDLAGARRDLSAADDALARWGPLYGRCAVLTRLATAEYRLGAWDDAIAHAELAVALSRDSHERWLFGRALLAIVAPLAGRGEWEAAVIHAEAVEAHAQAVHNESALVNRALTMALLACARSDHQAVVDALAPVHDLPRRDGADEPGTPRSPWLELYADALVALGRLEAAEAVLAPWEARARARGGHSAMANAARVRGNLAAARGRPSQAEAAFVTGLEHAEAVSYPFDRARLEAAYGGFRRRLGQRTAAVAHLRAAADLFTSLGARPYLERCNRELAACGLVRARRRDPDRSRLTPQELSVARLVASGLNNRTVATELFVSINTVEFHLKNVFGKLGIRSRDQLAKKMATA